MEISVTIEEKDLETFNQKLEDALNYTLSFDSKMELKDKFFCLTYSEIDHKESLALTSLCNLLELRVEMRDE